MIIPLIDQRLFLAEQYIAAQAQSEACALILQLLDETMEYSEGQVERIVKLLITLELDEAVISFFESGQQIPACYLPELIYAYARSGLFETTTALCEQLPTQQQAVVHSQIAQIRSQWCEQQVSTCQSMLQATQPNWEQLMSVLRHYPELLTYPEIFAQLAKCVDEGMIQPPYLALIVDLAAQQKLFFKKYQTVKPLELTSWVQDVKRQLTQEVENHELLQQLVTWQILQIYPNELTTSGFADVELFMQTLKQQLALMLSGEIDG
ncbi:MAG: hypothetical protein ACRC3J_02690 [Culicoidibacterales bacterium]